MHPCAWIVGGSSGIGLELVKVWLEHDYRVISSARAATSTPELQQLQQHYPAKLHLIDLDVTDTADVMRVSDEVWRVSGGLDLWFYNAGTYHVMRHDAWNLEWFEQMNATNYMGALRLMHALLPYFKRQGLGRWVFNASLSSYFGLPYGGGYSAPKAALVNLAESLQPELNAIGIRVSIINHGFVKTRLTAKNDFEMPQLMEPADAARAIFEGLKNERAFEIRFPRTLSFVLRLLRFLPYALSLRLTKKTL